jgi:hypothetical protein
MPKTVKETKQNHSIRLRPSLVREVKKAAQDNKITEQSIYENGIAMYLKYLEEKEAETV